MRIRFRIVIIFIVSMLLLSFLLGGFLLSKSQAHTCIVHVDGLRYLVPLKVSEQRSANLRSDCGHPEVSSMIHSVPLKVYLASRSLPTEIRLSAESEGIGFLGVSLHDHRGRSLYSTSVRIPVRSYSVLRPRLRQAVLYHKTILRVSLSADEAVWKFAEPYTVRLWLFDSQWRLLSKGPILVTSRGHSLPKRFYGYFFDNTWTFDFELPLLSTPPAYGLIVGGGRRGLPDEFDFETVVDWGVVASTNAPYSPLAAPRQSPTRKVPCRWRWWYTEQNLMLEAPKMSIPISEDFFSPLSRYVNIVIDKTNLFYMATKDVASLLIWHETPYSCETFIDCDMDVQYSLVEQWNKGGIYFSQKEFDQIFGQGIKGTRAASPPIEYQFFHKLTVILNAQDQPEKMLDSVFAACSHPKLQRPFGSVSSTIVSELPAAFPVQGAYIGGGYPLGTILGRANIGHEGKYQGRDWLHLRANTIRYYYFGIPAQSSLSKAVFEENNSVAIVVEGRCRFEKPSTFIFN